MKTLRVTLLMVVAVLAGGTYLAYQQEHTENQLLKEQNHIYRNLLGKTQHVCDKIEKYGIACNQTLEWVADSLQIPKATNPMVARIRPWGMAPAGMTGMGGP